MSSISSNKKEKFLAAIEAHKKIIYKVVNSYCRNTVDRKDLEQEIIIQLWSSFDKYNPKFKYSTWMYRIALNVAISHYRKEKKWVLRNDLISEDLIFTNSDQGEYNSELDQNIQLLQEFINNLNELNKALMLLYLEEKPHAEIAEILGISKSNVATKIGRLKIKLKNEFQKHLE